jgi:hypothetical protein
MNKDLKYPDATPVDEPIAPVVIQKQKVVKTKSVQYPDSVPVDEPVSKKKYAKGGSVKSGIDGVAQNGKTRCKVV